MKLHRASSKPEWDQVNHDEHNSWQKLAASTNGIITPGNIATMAGVVTVFVALGMIINRQYWLGLILLAVGRSLDVLDGYLADVTGTKSPLGEKLDAGFDKLTTFLTLLVFIVTKIAPLWLIVALASPHILISVIALGAYQKNLAPHPSRAGKTSMAMAWVTLVGLVTLKAVSAPFSSVTSLVVYGLAGLSVTLGFYAAAGYFKDLT